MAFTSFAMYGKIGANFTFAWEQIWVNGIKCGICCRFAVYLLYWKIRFFVQCEGYAAISTSDLRLTIRRTKPTKPSVDPTTSTPFEIIEIKGKVHKCAGCGGQLKDGPDAHLKTDLDKNLCLRHKEHDYVWIKSQNCWKTTFENKHFHVYRSCLVGRNPGFNFQSIQMSIPYTLKWCTASVDTAKAKSFWLRFWSGL